MAKLSPAVILLIFILWLVAFFQLYSAYIFQGIKITSFAFLIISILATYLILKQTKRSPEVTNTDQTSSQVNYKLFSTWAPLGVYIFNAIPLIKVWNMDDLGLAGIPVLLWGGLMLIALPFAIIPLVTRDVRLSRFLGSTIYFILSIPTTIILFLIADELGLI